MARSPARPVSFRNLFWIVFGFTAAAFVAAFILAVLPPDRQSDLTKSAFTAFMSIANGGFGGILGMLLGRHGPK